MIRLNNELFDWQIALPLIMSVLAFKKPLPDDVLDTLYHRAKKMHKDLAEKN